MCMSMGHGGAEHTETPLEILRKRLARGEITLEQYKEMKAILDEEIATDAHQGHQMGM